ncbi:MAG: hypothetical protein BWY70_01725 [Bacteroidetes bacterium ADurb.Bin408]|nr:MAG: hypothetical protein BWY70_01725 [Bacteroidetes bacterium ADurb.Bin408]
MFNAYVFIVFIICSECTEIGVEPVNLLPIEIDLEFQRFVYSAEPGFSCLRNKFICITCYIA